MDTATTPRTLVSKVCADGRHHMCLGTVLLPQPVRGRSVAPCACPHHDRDEE